MVTIYVINLDRAPERLASMSRQLDRQSLSFNRVPAIDGSLLTQAEHDAFVSEFPRGETKAWLLGQIGCFRSHRLAWAQAAKDNQAFSLILEDDVHLADDLGVLLSDLRWIPKDADLVRIETAPNSLRLGKPVAIPGTARRCRQLRSPAWAAGAYLIRGDVAAWLLAAPARSHAPTDFFLFDSGTSQVARALNTVQVVPAVAVQDKFSADHAVERQGFHSDIEGDHEDDHAYLSKYSCLKSSMRRIIGRTTVQYHPGC